MISLRLSESEYEALKNQYRTLGARNLSELARLALQRISLMPAVVKPDFAAKLAELDSRVYILEARNPLLTGSADTLAKQDHEPASEVATTLESLEPGCNARSTREGTCDVDAQYRDSQI